MSERLQLLDSSGIIRILPHKPPAVMIDRVIEAEPGKRLVASKNVVVSEPIFSGHFPGMPIMPGSAVIEVLVQTCCLLVYVTEPYVPAEKIVALVGVNKAKFHRAICPADVLEIEVELLRRRSNVWRFSGHVYENDMCVAEAELALSIYDRDDKI